MKKLLQTKYFIPLFIGMMTMSSCKTANQQKSTKQETRDFYQQNQINKQYKLNYSEIKSEFLKTNKDYWDAKFKLDSLENRCTMADQMEREINAAHNTLLDKTLKELNDRYLSLFNISVSRAQYIGDNTICGPYIMNHTQNQDDMPMPFDNVVLHVTGMHQYPQKRQQEITKQIRNFMSYANVQAEIIANDICKKYGKYYPVLDKDKYVPAIYRQYIDPALTISEGTMGARHLNYANVKHKRDFTICHMTAAYTNIPSKLFTDDTECTYRLIYKDSQWYIKMTHPDGTDTLVNAYGFDQWQTLPVPGNIVPEFNVSPVPNSDNECYIYTIEPLAYIVPEIADDKLPDTDGVRAQQIQQTKRQITELHAKRDSLQNKLRDAKQTKDSVNAKIHKKRFSKHK